jgi:hypothetical protein
MADEQVQEVEQAEEPQGEPKAKTDWKAEARKWEALAKKGKAAEEELAKLRESQMTEQEKVVARAEKAEAKLREMEAEAERLQVARELSAKESVPLELLELLPTENMEQFVRLFKAYQVPAHAAATFTGQRIDSGGGKVNPRDAFVAFAEQQFK